MYKLHISIASVLKLSDGGMASTKSIHTVRKVTVVISTCCYRTTISCS